MQTKLRICVSLVVASLLWTSPTSAANKKSGHHKAPAVKKLRYIGNRIVVRTESPRSKDGQWSTF